MRYFPHELIMVDPFETENVKAITFVSLRKTIDLITSHSGCLYCLYWYIDQTGRLAMQ